MIFEDFVETFARTRCMHTLHAVCQKFFVEIFSWTVENLCEIREINDPWKSERGKYFKTSVVLMCKDKIRFIKRNWQSYHPQPVVCLHRRLLGEYEHAVMLPLVLLSHKDIFTVCYLRVWLVTNTTCTCWINLNVIFTYPYPYQIMATTWNLPLCHYCAHTSFWPYETLLNICVYCKVAKRTLHSSLAYSFGRCPKL